MADSSRVRDSGGPPREPSPYEGIALAADPIHGYLTFTVPIPGSGGPHKETTDKDLDRKSTRLNSSHIQKSRMPSSA